MNIDDKDPVSLLRDKSLASIWWKINVTGRRGTKNSGFAVVAVVLVGIAICVYLAVADTNLLPDQIRFICLHGLKMVTGVLSFLLAGFMFLLSASNADMLSAMFSVKHKETGLDYLRYNSFSLLALFAEFVFGAFLFSLVVVFGQPKGMLPWLVNLMPHDLYIWAIRIAFFVSSMLFILFVLRLKSFVTSIYHFAMTGLVFKFDAMAHESDTPDVLDEAKCKPALHQTTDLANTNEPTNS